MSNKFSKHKWWIVTALLTLPLIAIAAVPNTFTAGTTIASAQVNAELRRARRENHGAGSGDREEQRDRWS